MSAFLLLLGKDSDFDKENADRQRHLVMIGDGNGCLEGKQKGEKQQDTSDDDQRGHAFPPFVCIS